MGTRAIYQFTDLEDTDDQCFVYKHYDNYPQGAVEFIENAKAYAWEFPRFEADEFASAFVAANKNPKGGEVRLVSNHLNGEAEILEAHHWCDYHYIIYWDRYFKDLWIEVQESVYQKDGSVEWKTIWDGSHTQMKEKYRECSIAV